MSPTPIIALLWTAAFAQEELDFIDDKGCADVEFGDIECVDHPFVAGLAASENEVLTSFWECYDDAGVQKSDCLRIAVVDAGGRTHLRELEPRPSCAGTNNPGLTGILPNADARGAPDTKGPAEPGAGSPAHSCYGDAGWSRWEIARLENGPPPRMCLLSSFPSLESLASQEGDELLIGGYIPGPFSDGSRCAAWLLVTDDTPTLAGSEIPLDFYLVTEGTGMVSYGGYRVVHEFHGTRTVELDGVDDSVDVCIPDPITGTVEGADPGCATPPADFGDPDTAFDVTYSGQFAGTLTSPPALPGIPAIPPGLALDWAFEQLFTDETLDLLTDCVWCGIAVDEMEHTASGPLLEQHLVSERDDVPVGAIELEKDLYRPHVAGICKSWAIPVWSAQSLFGAVQTEWIETVRQVGPVARPPELSVSLAHDRLSFGVATFERDFLLANCSD